MNHTLHAHRYREKMQSAIARVELLNAANPGTTDPSQSVLAAEFDGMSQAELGARRDLLNHLELLMYDWQNDGCTSYDADDVLSGNRTNVSTTYDLLASIEGDIVYLHFGHRAELGLADQSDGFVEGLYLREAFIDGVAGFEVTIVCGGPAWAQLENLSFSAALRAASQIAIGFVELDAEIKGLLPSDLDGDRKLINDGVLLTAIRLADKMLGALAFSDRSVTIRDNDCQSGYPR